MTDELMCRRFEQFFGRTGLQDFSLRHHDNAVGESQRFGLVVRHIDERQLELLVNLLELAPQEPFDVRVDHGERFVEQHRGDVWPDESAAEREPLLDLRRQSRARRPRSAPSSRISAIS